MTTLAFDFLALLRQRQAVEFYDVVEHPGKDPNDATVLLPVKTCGLRERIEHELREIDTSEQAAAIRGQRLFSTWLLLSAVVRLLTS